MPKASPGQTSFITGEVSKNFQGRTDSERYKSALATCENYILTLQGAVTRRPGTKFIGEVKCSECATRLIPFERSDVQAYMLELGDEYIRFYKDDALIATDLSFIVTGVSQGSPATVTMAGHTITNGTRVIASTFVGMTELNNREFIVQSVSANAVTLYDAQNTAAIDSSLYNNWTSGGDFAIPYEVSTSFVAAEVSDIKYVQSADVLYLVHPDHSVSKLLHYGDTQWSLNNVNLFDGPYLEYKDLQLIGTPSAASGTITLGINGQYTSNEFPEYIFPFTASIGRLVRMKQGSHWAWGTVVGHNGGTGVTVTLGDDLASTATITDWRLGEYGTVSTLGFPRCVTFHENRLVLGGSVIRPQTINASQVNDYENFAPTVQVSGSAAITAECGFNLAIGADKVQTVRWVSSDEKGMILGTYGGPWMMRPTSLGEALTPDNATAKRTSSYGTADLQPVLADKATIFVQNSGKKVREFIYFYDVDGFRSTEVSILANHIAGPGIIELAMQSEPHPTIWGCRSDGTLTSMLYERDLDNLKVGWSRQILGGVGTAFGTSPVAESIASLPDASSTRDDIWMVAARYVNGTTHRYIEKLTKVFEERDDATDAFFVDCGLTYDSTATSRVSGLYHLEGAVVSVLTDGAVHPDVTVSHGKIDLQYSASTIQIGYSYDSKLQLLRNEAGSADGTAMGKTRRINRLGLLLDRVGEMEVGFDFTNMDSMVFRHDADPLGIATPLFSGVESLEIESDYNFDNQVCIKQSDPLPGTILGIYAQINTQDR